ncbi:MULTISPECIES: PAAR domain-containing protein [Pseudomonas]|uniref:PAAR domain-containing protein n=1 Tax=Pseudomonas TaxID=286 RepID=UPI0018AACC76|nr:PAAR domain-containing protein [Pseudomonas guariconensis]MBF8795762.1 PAAR domain-containing protein [Pseudomonas monteilii]MBF8719991.1 PAAR domain-containing protein [Pseudomonas guariconensis]MBF8724263.1 PAAR domain-containing protein [Pseudomonas guariconensis]MBF8739627.1 PAAR domain-containing protein [Pseudomonas guariconensis]MBF8749229.1 PAAR domain-containing protein [Pseudomonas guariconensis]
MKPIALVGHLHICPLHGKGTITTGASATFVNGKPIARAGDEVSCGAIIETGSVSTLIEGHPAARQGDTTDHGGTIVEGDADWLVE